MKRKRERKRGGGGGDGDIYSNYFLAERKEKIESK